MLGLFIITGIPVLSHCPLPLTCCGDDCCNWDPQSILQLHDGTHSRSAICLSNVLKIKSVKSSPTQADGAI